MNETVGFIGGGNMARSLIGGLLRGGQPASGVLVAEPVEALRTALAQDFSVQVTEQNAVAMAAAQNLVFAVKPQVLSAVAQDLADCPAAAGQLIISIAAGIREPDLNHWLGGGRAIVRAMPNTPALVGEGMTGLYANSLVSSEQRRMAADILSAVGAVLWLEQEAAMDAVTAISGSGPAYFFLVMEVLERTARELGLEPPQARQLTLQTARGAALLAAQSEVSLAQLRNLVTSPGGTTEAALTHLLDGGFEALFTDAIRAAHRRSIELANP